jgi:hypothetical protein
MIRVRQVAGGGKNVTFHVTGILTGEMTFEEIAIDRDKKDVKLASLVWLIQEKLGLVLWWDKKTEVLPMESRNSVRFDTSLRPPEGWDGSIYLTSFGFAAPKKLFFLVLDFDR